MLTQDQLAALHHSLQSEWVLTVYVDGGTSMSDNDRRQRIRLEEILNQLHVGAARAPAGHAEHLAQCIRHLGAPMAAGGRFDAAVAWVAFITADGIRECHELPTPVRTAAYWAIGAHVAPYLRALAAARPIVVAVADDRRVRLHQYVLGRLTRVETLRRRRRATDAGPSTPAAGTGARGKMCGAAASDPLAIATNRMLGKAVERIRELAGPEGWIVLGNILPADVLLARQLARVTPRRVLDSGELDVTASRAEMARAGRLGASMLRSASAGRRLATIADVSLETVGALGLSASRRALEQASVTELYLTDRFLDENPAEAEESVRAALERGARIEEVVGEAADWLDTRGGVAVRAHLLASADPLLADADLG